MTLQKKYNRVITFGTFDLFHIGHVRILKRCYELADEVIVGLSTDELNYSKKQRYPVFSFEQRKEIIESCKFVKEVFAEQSLQEKRNYILEYKADVLIMGDDWLNKFDEYKDICDVLYLPRTQEISTTDAIIHIKNL